MTTRVARHSCSGSALPLRVCRSASSKPMTPAVSRCVAESTSTWFAWAAAWTRAAVLTASPATMPSLLAPRVTATSPVTTPARAARESMRRSAPSSRTASTRSSAARTARSASDSVATGVPHTAITASPMNFSTTPPYRPITVVAVSKYAESSSRTSSGSRASESGVKPTRSQKRTEQSRRSATGTAAWAWRGTAAAAAAGSSGPPQWPQNLNPAVTGWPHDGQDCVSAAPHSPQKRMPSELVVPHEAHCCTARSALPDDHAEPNGHLARR